jgi:hypothetical protein
VAALWPLLRARETHPSGLGQCAGVGPRCIEERIAINENESSHIPVTYECCDHITGPFYHGTKAVLVAGDELVPGYGSNFQKGRVSNNIYFTSLVSTAAWGAELATALAGIGERGHLYVVEPLGSFEDDPNVTDKKFPGNPTESYRTRHPLRVVGEVDSWEGHAPEVLKRMLDNLALMQEQGLDVIED